ncbi:hypothetical protein [Parasphingorhabdus sp.]|uniref:hypothetical protein n=1 Tax=Parasphingorhabdus sp. TaxID=2709688 RepID=UPI0007F4DB99|nr:hypothetical protein A8B75_12125 [Sphingomonadales bacterium EhC05]
MRAPKLLTSVIGLNMIAIAIGTTSAQAQEVSLNYDTLSSLEEPLAFELGDITVELTGLIDVPVEFDISSSPDAQDVDIGFTSNFQINAETQLANRWTLGVAYFGQYDQGTDDYSDNVAAYVGTSWGTLIGGNVDGLVREQTRRARGVGNASLAFDSFYGGLDNWGGGYVGRYGPMQISGAVDENGDFEIGTTFQRPIGRKDYRLSARIAEGTFTSQDGTTLFNTRGGELVGELTYGSSIFDLGIGYERLASSTVDADRWFVSAGARTKINSWSLSAEAHYGEVDGQSEKSAAAGIGYDIARGVSLNLGVNYEDANINIGGVNLNTTDEIKGIFSLRYSF